MILTAFTDGACSGNPGPGGWGAILVARDDNGGLLKELELGGHALETTNNQMEMMAALSALETLDRPSVITVKSDSKYLIDGITKWINGWKARGWKTKDKKPVKNEDIWRRLDAMNQKHQVTWKWVKGHNGHKMNERADALAVKHRDIAKYNVGAQKNEEVVE